MTPEDFHRASHDLAQRRDDLFASGDAASEREDYEAALDSYLLVAYLDVLGRFGPVVDPDHDLPRFTFDQYFAFPASNGLHRIARCVNELGLDLFTLQMRFLDVTAPEADAIARLNPPITPEQAWGRFEELLREWIKTGSRWGPRASPKAEGGPRIHCSPAI